MKLIFVIISFICFRTIASAQTKIELPLYYSGVGIVFSDSIKNSFKIQDKKVGYQPSLDEVVNAEEILKSDILKSNKKLFKKLNKYNRQYLGYITNDGEKVILIVLLNFSNKRKACKYFENWEHEIIIGFGDFYENNLSIYKVNLNSKISSIY